MKELLEIRAGQFDSSFSKFGTRITPLRDVTRYEIELFDADFFYTIINGKKIPFRKNTLIVAKPGDKRQSKLHFCCQFIHLSLADGELKAFFDNLPEKITLSNAAPYKAIFDKLCLLSISERKRYETIACLYKLISLLQEETAISAPVLQKEEQNPSSHTLSFALRYIEENFACNISLSDLAQKVNLSPNYFHKVFKRAYGITPSQYVAEIRLAHAKYLLMNSNKKVSEIASLCGYGSQSYFSSAFQQKFGIYPSTFKERYKNLL